MTYLYSYFVGELLFDLHLLKERKCRCNFTFLNSPSCKTGVKNHFGISGLEYGIIAIQTVYFTVLCSNLSNLERVSSSLFKLSSFQSKTSTQIINQSSSATTPKLQHLLQGSRQYYKPIYLILRAEEKSLKIHEKFI